VIYGNVIQSSADAAYLARHVVMYNKMDIDTPAVTINRLCGSGFQSVIDGAREIILGESEMVMTGGTENMSAAPYALRNARFGTKFGTDLKLEDTLWAGLTDSYCKTPMAITAENLAEKYSITRRECDELAVRSQDLWAKAARAGHFDAEICTVAVQGKKGVMEDFSVDEHPRPGTTLETAGKLAPVFKKDGVVTAGNSSGICDGAASVLLASEGAAATARPLARVVAWHVAGVDPSIMGIGPVPAIQGALKKAKLCLDDMDLIEVNEAFAAQFLAVGRELRFDMDKVNKCGGAMAMGHPLGASGARITGHLAHALQREQKRYAIGSACIGGGQGIAIILERV